MITVSWLMAKHCPYVDEIDVGTLTVTCPANAPELHRLTARIKDEIAAKPVTHEEFTRQVAALLPPGSEAVWQTRTAGGDVEVREAVA